MNQEEEVAHEQAYVDWAYKKLDEMVRRASSEDTLAAAGDIGAHRALEQIAERRQKQLDAAQDSLVFGRLDFLQPRFGYETIYVGRTHVDGEKLDRHAVIDWRAQVAETFYRATNSDAMGVGRRRIIQMRGKEVESLHDEPLVDGFTSNEVPSSPIVLPEDHSQPTESPEEDDIGIEIRAEDLLLSELAQARTGQMKDVVATIQADQDRLIRAEGTSPLVIQGGPGTGKTIVGLHRAAYLMYHQRQDNTDDSMLIVGPNSAFLDYIRAVLPSLDESSAQQRTLGGLAASNLTQAQRDSVEVNDVAHDEAVRVLGDSRMAAAVQAAVWSRPSPQAIQLGYRERNLRLDEDMVSSVISDLRMAHGSYSAAKNGLAEGLGLAFYGEYAKRLRAQRQTFRLGERERQSVIAATRELLTQEGLGRRLMPDLEAHVVVADLLSDLDLLQNAGLTVSEANAIYRGKARDRTRTWAREHLPLVDEAAMLIRGRPAQFTHIVVDEAQDLSPMQWRLISRRLMGSSITILGDLAQGISVWAPTSWDEVLKRLDAKAEPTIRQLRLGYRVPRPIMDFASNLSEVAAPDFPPPVSFRSGPEPEVIRTRRSELVKRAIDIAEAHSDALTAIIAPKDLLPGIHEQLNKPDSEHIHAMEVEQARGREFDMVCVVEPTEIAKEAIHPTQTLYLALTRTTNSLTIVHSIDLPAQLARVR